MRAFLLLSLSLSLYRHSPLHAYCGYTTNIAYVPHLSTIMLLHIRSPSLLLFMISLHNHHRFHCRHPNGGRFDPTPRAAPAVARPPRHNGVVPAQAQTLHAHLYSPNYYTNGVSTTARPYLQSTHPTSHLPRSLEYDHGYPVQRFGRTY